MVVASFGSRAVSKLTGITQRQLQYWDEHNLVKPSVSSAEGRGSIRLYSFADLVQLKVLKGLRDNGITLQKVRKSLHYLNKNFPNVAKPLAELSFVTDGETIFAISKTNRDAIDTLKQGQLVMYIALGSIVEELKRDVTIYTRKERERIAVRGKLYTVEIEPDTEDGGFVAECLDIKGCATQGETKAEVLENIKEVIDLCLSATMNTEVKQRTHQASSKGV